MKKTSVSILLLIMLVVSGCTSTSKKKKTSNVSDATSQKTEQQPSSEPKSETSESLPPSGEFTVSVDMGGEELYNFTSWSRDGGVAINAQSSGIAGLQKFTDWINSKCNKTGCLSLLECDNIYAQYQLYDGLQYPCIDVGTGSSHGTITWNSDLNIVKVEITARPYYKYVAYTDSWNHDTERILNVDGEAHVFASPSVPEQEEITTPEVITKTYSSAVKKFTLSNTDGGRIFLDNIKVTFSN